MPTIKFKIFGKPGDEVIAFAIRALQFVFAICIIGIDASILLHDYSEFEFIPLGISLLTIIFLISTVVSRTLYDTLMCSILEFLYLGAWTVPCVFSFSSLAFGCDFYDDYNSFNTCSHEYGSGTLCALSGFLFLVTIILRFTFSSGSRTPLKRFAIFSYPYVYDARFDIKIFEPQFGPARQLHAQQLYPPIQPSLENQPHNPQQAYLPGQYPSAQQQQPPIQQPYPQQPYSQPEISNQPQAQTHEQSQYLPNDETSSTHPSHQIVVNRESTFSQPYPLNSPFPNASNA